MSEFRSATIGNGDISIHAKSLGNPESPLLICLHGFPEYWAAWADVAGQLSNRFHVVMPDLRGFNLSSRPQNIEDYAVKHTVSDVSAVAEHFCPEQPFLLAGHDWGAALAYAFAFRHPERLTGLVIANGVHPWCFQNAIINDPEQRKASQYINRLRLPEATDFMAQDNFARMLNMMTGFSSSDWMSGEKKAGYVDAWRQPGAMHAMLNWYRSSPILVPGLDAENATSPILNAPVDVMTVNVPHLVVWGTQDQALRPSCLNGIERFAPDLKLEKVDGSGHWILHEQPERVAGLIEQFADRL